MDYAAYLMSDAWKEKRTKVRRRARGWCERCKWRKRVDVHHLTYERVPNEPLSDLIGVCRPCHRFLHGRRSTDPAIPEFSKEEVRLARELTQMAEYIGRGRIKGYCMNWPEYEPVRQKMGW
jgi:hypothetical protein